ncbi:siderophore-interacting protein [Actinophytocola sp.]|uniref:siderophore-interacting protein n=1 Tax=Actinophytocola sp. TaxID=1872138 RepID=UPI00389AA441
MTAVQTEVQSYVLFRVAVVRTERISPKMLRVTFGGPSLSGCVWAGHDHRVKLFLPLPGQTDPVVPEGPDWFAEYRAMPAATKPPMRTFTIRELRPDSHELDVDFVLHGDLGPASTWAGRARPGDRVAILGPNARCPTVHGYEYRPDADTDWTLLAGDETALPAITGILAALPAERTALVFVEVESAAEIRPLPCAGNARVTWLSRDGGPAVGGGLLREAIGRAEFPTGRPYAWLAGESSAVTGLRRHLVRDRGIDRKDVYFSGYWLLGSAIE